MDYSDKFSDILNPSESIIKVYKPNKVKYYFIKILWLLLYFCFFMWIDAALSLGMGNEPEQEVFNLDTFLIVICVTIVLFTCIFVYLVYFYRNLYYCVTSERIIIRKGVFGTDYKTLDMQMIGVTNVNVSIFDKIVNKNTGSISFGSNSAPVFGQNATFMFRDIENPYVECREIKTAIDNCKSKALSQTNNQGNNQNENNLTSENRGTSDDLKNDKSESSDDLSNEDKGNEASNNLESEGSEKSSKLASDNSPNDNKTADGNNDDKITW